MIKRFFDRYGRIILISLALIGISIAFKGLESYLESTSAEHDAWAKFGLELLNHASIAFFSVAILGFILETTHFYKYFHGLIVETIIEKQFLEDLKPAALENIKKKCLETFFHIKELNQEEGFYRFYLDKIEKHIGGPFREQTIAMTRIEYSSDRKAFIATDDIQYTCRKLGDKIQDSAGWTAEKDEIEDLSEFEITVTKPGDAPFSLGYKKGEVPDPALEQHPGHGFTFHLDDYKDCDGLFINVKAVFIVPFERPFSWTMPCLSHGFSGSIVYPDGVDLFVDSFGLDEALLPNRPAAVNGVRTYHFEHKSWLLPDNGFSFHLRPQRQPSPVQEQQPAATPI